VAADTGWPSRRKVVMTAGFGYAPAAARLPHFGLDKSTLSRQLEQLISAGLLRREGEQPGRRGSVLALTPSGEQHLKAAAQAVRDRLAERLTGWDDGDIATFAQFVTRFNQSRG
jgi:DNA-binding MarR family transcriptional regulator